MQWSKITDIILFTSFATLAIFAILGLCQWMKRKSLKKVDKELLWAILPFSIMAITYIVFDKFFVLNTRPDGSGEPSFPSSHVMVVTTIFLVVAITLPKYVESKTARIILDLMMLAFIILVSIGRVFANKHWASDVVAGLVFATIFATIYYLIIRRYKNG